MIKINKTIFELSVVCDNLNHQEITTMIVKLTSSIKRLLILGVEAKEYEEYEGQYQDSIDIINEQAIIIDTNITTLLEALKYLESKASEQHPVFDGITIYLN
jgi:hypothetical protein